MNILNFTLAPPVAENVLAQMLVAPRPNETWVTALIYPHKEERRMYVAAVKDLSTCEVVGHAMESGMTTDLVSQALIMAVGAKRPHPGLIHHSDRGAQYCAQAYQD